MYVSAVGIAVALSSPMHPITADAPVSDVRHQHRSDTNQQMGCYIVTLRDCSRSFTVTYLSANDIEQYVLQITNKNHLQFVDWHHFVSDLHRLF